MIVVKCRLHHFEFDVIWDLCSASLISVNLKFRCLIEISRLASEPYFSFYPEFSWFLCVASCAASCAGHVVFGRRHFNIIMYCCIVSLCMYYLMKTQELLVIDVIWI